MHLKEVDANLLVVLDALLTHGSVTKAAESLGRTPSAVSHALSNLRHLFQDELFIRAGQQLVPTAKALALADDVHEIVRRMEQLLTPPRPFDPKVAERTFIFASSEACELTLLHNLRERLREEAPGMRVRWAMMHPERSFQEMRDGKIEFIIHEDKRSFQRGADFIWGHLFDEAFVTLARPGHPLSRRTITPEEFAAAEHVMVSREADGGDLVEAHLRMHGIAPNVAVRASTVFAGLFLALDSYYLITVPASIARAIRKRVPFAVIHQPFPALQQSKYMCWHKSLDGDDAHSWIRAKVTEMVNDLQDGTMPLRLPVEACA